MYNEVDILELKESILNIENKINKLLLLVKNNYNLCANLIKYFETLGEILEPYDLFLREYIVFTTIMDMVRYIFKETENLSSDHLDFINDVCSSFFNILRLKLDLFKEYDYKFSNEFKKAYERPYFSYRKHNSGFVRKFTNGIFVSDYDNPEVMREYCRLVYEGK